MTGLAGSQPYGPGLSHSVISMFLAFLLMYPLFKIGTLGAGDIKVLIMTGSFLVVKEFIAVLLTIFIVAAAMSVGKLLVERNGRERLICLLSYASAVAKSRRWELYGEDLRQDNEAYHSNKIHFTIAVLLGTALRIGGLI